MFRREFLRQMAGLLKAPLRDGRIPGEGRSILSGAPGVEGAGGILDPWRLAKVEASS